MIFKLRKNVIMMLVLQLVLAPIMVTHAQILSADALPIDEATHSENQADDLRLSGSNTREAQISAISYQPDFCNEADGSTDRCAMCLCINSGVFNIDLGINDLLYQTAISPEIANSSYFIHSIPLLRPPIF